MFRQYVLLRNQNNQLRSDTVSWIIIPVMFIAVAGPGYLLN